jgi:hypothetical protein
VVIAILYPEVLVLPVHDYHFVSLVSTRRRFRRLRRRSNIFQFPFPRLQNEPVTPRPEAMRVPAELVQKKTARSRGAGAQVTLAAKKEILPDVKPEIPRPPVKTNVFSNGSSATPTMAAAPQKYKLAASAIRMACPHPIITAVRSRSRRPAR